MDTNIQYGGSKQVGVFTILVYLLALALAGYFAWKYTAGKYDGTKRYLIVAGAVLAGYILMYLLRSLTFNL